MNTIMALIGLAYAKYIKQNTVPIEDASITGFSKVLCNKYYLENLYDAIFVKPMNAFSVFEFGKVTNEMSYQEKKLKT